MAPGNSSATMERLPASSSSSMVMRTGNHANPRWGSGEIRSRWPLTASAAERGHDEDDQFFWPMRAELERLFDVAGARWARNEIDGGRKFATGLDLREHALKIG